MYPLALRPSRLDAGLVERVGVIFAPNQQEITLPITNLLCRITVGKGPTPLHRHSEPLRQLAQKTPNPLSSLNRCRRDRADLLLDMDFRSRHAADALPILNSSMTTSLQPQDDALIVVRAFRQN